MNRSAKNFIYTLLIFIVFPLYSEVISVIAKRYSVPEGLINPYVKAIIQDSKGFLWIGTEGGLCRFDGYKFINYKNFSNKSVNINSLAEGDNGDIWIGTEKGLSILNRGSGRFSQFNEKPEIQTVNSLFRFPGARIMWIGSSEGLYMYDLDDNSCSSVVPVINNRDLKALVIKSLYGDKRGNLWIGTSKSGIIRYSRRSNLFTAYSSGKMADSAVLTMTEDRVDNLWIGTSRGLWHYSFATESMEPVEDIAELNNIPVPSVICAPSGKLYVGTRGRGLYKMDVWSRKLAKISNGTLVDSDTYNRYAEIEALFVDRNRNIWTGTQFRGFYVFNIQGKKFTHIRGSLPGETTRGKNFVYSITEDKDGDIWVGTYRGIEFFNSKLEMQKMYFGSVNRLDTIGNHSVRSLLPDGNGIIWVATTGGGLSRIEKSTGKIRRYMHNPSDKGSLSSNFCKYLLEDRKRRLWIATEDRGLNLFNRKKKKFRSIPLSDNLNSTKNKVYTMYEDPVEENILWLGTFGGGLCKFNTETHQKRWYVNNPDDPSSLSNDSVIFIDSDEQGNVLWIGTFGGGICRFFKNSGKFQRFTTQDGLRDNYVYSIMKDSSGYFWLSSNSGIAKFDPGKAVFRYYGISDGVQGLEFNGGAWYKNRNGRIFMGGVNGFNTFYPEDVVEDNIPPSVQVTEIRIDRKEVKVGVKYNGIVVMDKDVTESSRIKLSPGMRSVEIDISALDFTDSSKNEYAYKLSGFDYKWNHLGNKRTVVLHNLPGGEYQLQIKASNSDKVWSETPLVITIEVEKPFTGTVLFTVILHITMILILGAILGGIIRKLRKSNRNMRRDMQISAEREKVASSRIKELEETINDSVSQRRYGLLSSVFVDKLNPSLEKLFSGLSYISEQVSDVRSKLDKGEFNKNSFDNWFDLHKRSMEHLVITAGRAVLTLTSFEKVLIDYRQYSTEIFRPGELIKRSVETELEDSGMKNVSVNISGDESTKVESYPLILNEIMIVLLNNSILHGFRNKDSGSVSVNYELEKGIFRITFKDDGVGISDIDVGEVFEPLFTTRRSEGFQGVGLYILKNHVEIGLKGIVSVTSSPAETLFTIEFPV